MTCKNCYHYNVCCELMKQLHWKPELCNSFKDKSRIIEPTLNVGEKVWFLHRNSNEICEATVTRVEYNYFTNPQEWIEIDYISSPIGRLTYKTRIDLMLGKVVFFTKEEAESKLKEISNETTQDKERQIHIGGVKRIMAGLIAKQPNGLYCRISTVVDAPTDWNMTEQDYIDMCVKKAKEEAKIVLANYCYDFDVALNRVRYGKDTEMTTEEYEKFIKDCNTEVKEKG